MGTSSPLTARELLEEEPLRVSVLMIAQLVPYERPHLGSYLVELLSRELLLLLRFHAVGPPDGSG